MTLLGKRYECGSCNALVLCTKEGAGALSCCGEPMTEQQAKALPSSD